MSLKVFYLITVSCLVVLGFSVAAPNSRILEGVDTESSQTPWVVQVRVKNAHVGVGSIIHERFIITAAHIVTKQSPANINIRAGSSNQFSGGKLVAVHKVYEHPSSGNFLNDLAILELVEPLVFSDRIAHLEVPSDDSDIVEGTSTIVAGWGLNAEGASPYKLQHTTKLTVLSRENCEYEAGFGYPTVMCLAHAEGEGTCRGDEGAGVVINKKLYGVVSFSFGKCGTRFPDVAARLSQYWGWIDAIINQS